MRSGLLEDCFTAEEREFLAEITETACGEGRETLAAHEADIKEREGDIFKGDTSDLVAYDRQVRKIKFLELLHSCLGGEND